MCGYWYFELDFTFFLSLFFADIRRMLRETLAECIHRTALACDVRSCHFDTDNNKLQCASLSCKTGKGACSLQTETIT